MSDLLNSLNPRQKEAVMAAEGAVLVLAGAGSGKTRVLTHRAAYLISEKGVMPWNILAITFTNKAANEMKERIDRLCEEEGGMVWVATFHATCGRILRRHAELLGYTSNYTIYDTDDAKTLIKRVLKTLDIDSKLYPERMLLSRISAAKNTFVSPDDMYRQAGDYRERKIAEIYEEYQKQLKANDAMDFDDMLVKTVELFQKFPEVLLSWQERFRYIMVDEYQDTNAVQFEFIRLLAQRYGNICVVGDDDQSIYKFRGADIRNILDFEKSFPGAKVIKLEQNYRSTGAVLEVANEVIKHNRGRKAKTLWTDADKGDAVDYREYTNAYDEAEGVVMDIKANLDRFDYGDCAVLYRTNAQSRLLEEKCVLYSVPYRLVGGVNFYQRKEIKDIIAYLKTVTGAKDDIAVQRIINVPKRGIGQTTIAKISALAAEKNIDFYAALNEACDTGAVPSSAASKIRGFTGIIESIRAKQSDLTVKELVEAVCEESGYIRELRDEKTAQAESRIENIEELINKAAESEAEPGDELALSQFLEEVALVADVDSLDDDENRVVLMTLHGAKGLEFPRVYMTGMEEGLFPSYMSISSGDESDIEEERRLCYVGVTRAKEKLSLSAAQQRMVNGEIRFSPVSRFVGEIPDGMLDMESGAPRSKKPALTGLKGRGIPTAASFGNDYFDRTYKTKTSGKGIGGGSAAAYLGKDIMAKKPSSLDYSEGDRVRHLKFGEGTVTSIIEGKQDYEVTVDFDRVGSKKLFAGFAKLVKI